MDILKFFLVKYDNRSNKLTFLLGDGNLMRMIAWILVNN